MKPKAKKTVKKTSKKTIRKEVTKALDKEFGEGATDALIKSGKFEICI